MLNINQKKKLIWPEKTVDEPELRIREEEGK